MRGSDEAEYRDYVTVRLPAWRRTAYLMCRDWHLADDVVATALDKLYRRWPRRSEIANLDGYMGGIIARVVVDEHRRPWRRERVDDDAATGASARASLPASDVVERMTLDSYLAQLGPRRRTVLVLRFYCDLSVEETAEVLGISVGTVKSQTARGLETLRALALEPTSQPRQEP